jgi:ribosome-associated toxin RatA of RatAB toxin-antitoxin module
MPQITMEMEIDAPADRVWRTVIDIERYPDSMSSVRWVRLLEDNDSARRSKWSITLKGSILEWEETELLHHDDLVLEFHQLAGDMEQFDGAWRLTPRPAGRTHVALTIDFEIGIPLLAEMLNPVAQRSLRENCAEMLLGIERDSITPR